MKIYFISLLPFGHQNNNPIENKNLRFAASHLLCKMSISSNLKREKAARMEGHISIEF